MVPGLLLATLGLYLTTLSTGAYPGQAAALIAKYAQVVPTMPRGELLWLGICHLMEATAGGRYAAAVAVLSSVLGACGVALLYTIMFNGLKLVSTHHSHHTTPPDAVMRFGSACAALFLAVCAPYWYVATRGYPATFHLSLFLVCVLLLIRFARTGVPHTLYILCFLYGVCITEFATAVLFAPLMAVALVYLGWRHGLFEKRRHIPICLLSGLAGLSMYLVSAAVLMQLDAFEFQDRESYGQVVLYILRAQFTLIARSLPRYGWLLIGLMSVLPWVTCMGTSRRGLTAEREWSFVFMFGLFTILTISLLLNAPISPWAMHGTTPLLVTPYLLAAMVYGYLVTYWLLMIRSTGGGLSQGADSAWRQIGMGMVVFVVAALFCVAGVQNWKVGNARPAKVFNRLTEEIVNALGGRQWLVTDGALDNNIALTAHRLGRPDIRLINLYSSSRPIYLRYVDSILPKKSLAGLSEAGVFPALTQWMRTDTEFPQKVAVMPLPDFWLRGGLEARPDRVLFFGDSQWNPDEGTMQKHIEFWDEIVPELHAVTNSVDKVLVEYAKYYMRHLSLVANNLGVAYEDSGDITAAHSAYLRALKILPENISALLNLHRMIQRGLVPGSEDDLQVRLESIVQRDGRRRVWSLAQTFGYVRSPEAFLDLGLAWAMSGRQASAVAGLGKARALAGDVSTRLQIGLAGMYLSQQSLAVSRELYGDVLVTDPENTHALIGMSRIALAERDYVQSRSWLNRAEEAGVPEEVLAFESSFGAFMEGRLTDARDVLLHIIGENPSNRDAWVLLTEISRQLNDNDVLERCTRALEQMEAKNYLAHAALGMIAERKQQLESAVRNYEHALVQNPAATGILEPLIILHLKKNQPQRAKECVRVLLHRDAGDVFGNWIMGRLQLQAGDHNSAEGSFRRSIDRVRSPLALADLGAVLVEKNEHTRAESLLRECLEIMPNYYLAWSNLGRVFAAEKRYQEAQVAFAKALELNQFDRRPEVYLAALYFQMGETARARGRIDQLMKVLNALPARERARVMEMREQLLSDNG